MASAENSTKLRYARDPEPGTAPPVGLKLKLPRPKHDLPMNERIRLVMKAAEEAFAKTTSQTGSWVPFFREILGNGGAVQQWFPDADEYSKFQESKYFDELQEMVAALRSQDSSKSDAAEPERMITIRLPRSLHDMLKEESNELNLSINKLCISKLLQRIESRYIPVQQGQRRGRKPGPQGPRVKAGK